MVLGLKHWSILGVLNSLLLVLITLWWAMNLLVVKRSCPLTKNRRALPAATLWLDQLNMSQFHTSLERNRQGYLVYTLAGEWKEMDRSMEAKDRKVIRGSLV